MIQFTIPGRLRGKGRPRFARAGKFTRTYTDAKTESAEALVRDFAAEAMRGHSLITGPVEARIIVTLNPPASWSKKRREAARYVTGKPDPDNLQKLIFDACNKIVYGDDSQISFVSFGRYYSLNGQERVDVTFAALEIAPAQKAATA